MTDVRMQCVLTRRSSSILVHPSLLAADMSVRHETLARQNATSCPRLSVPIENSLLTSHRGESRMQLFAVHRDVVERPPRIAHRFSISGINETLHPAIRQPIVRRIREEINAAGTIVQFRWLSFR